MQLLKRILCVSGCVAGLLAIGVLSSPKLAAAIRGAFVEVAFPSQPFFATLSVPVNFPGPHAAGPETGTLGVTNLIVTNFLNTPANGPDFRAHMQLASSTSRSIHRPD